MISIHILIHQLARAGAFMVLRAGLAALLTRLGAGTDIAVASPIAGRTDEGLDELVGFFVNTLVLRTDTSGDPTFAELLAQVRETSLAAYTHQDVPFEYLVEKLNPHRSTAHHPLAQVMLTLQNTAEVHVDLPGLHARLENPGQGASEFDLLLNVAETFDTNGKPAGVTGFIEYATDLYNPSTVDAFGARLTRLLAAAAARPDQPIGSLEIVTGAERTRLLAWSGIAGPRPEPVTLPGLFAEQVARAPESAALVCHDGEWSYAELDRWSNRLAHRLIAVGVRPGQRVALVMRRGPELVAAMLGVLKTGAAYVPVDPDYPVGRRELMLSDADPAVVLDEAWMREDPNGYPDHPPEVAIHRGLAAYVIYTSGSTGTPKGVEVSHAGIASLAAAKRAAFGLGPGNRVLRFSSSSFDAMVSEFVTAYGSGSALVLPEQGDIAGDALAELIRRYRVNNVTLPPSVLATLPGAGPEDRLDALTTLAVAGEACPPGPGAALGPRPSHDQRVRADGDDGWRLPYSRRASAVATTGSWAAAAERGDGRCTVGAVAW